VILSGIDLLRRSEFLHEKIIDPFLPRGTIYGMSYGLSLVGYDIRVKQDVILPPGGFALASSVERFQVPCDLAGIVHDKSSWARKGIAVQNTVLEPGWRGWLTLEISNHSGCEVYIYSHSPIAQIIFHILSTPTVGYSGKYQNQANKPVEAIDEG
jgi:dCTP deaminase